jgi:putative membrane protein
MKATHLSKFVLAAAVWTLAAPAFGQDMASTNVPPTPMTAADFVWDASLINLKEIRLGEAAQSNSQNTAVQDFGKHMVRDHSRLNDRLVKIAAAEGLQLPATNTFYIPVTAPVEKQATQLLAETPQQKLQDAQLDVQNLASLSGPDFDQAYATAMVKGHGMALQEFQDASTSLTDEQLKRYAERGVRAIRDHYEMAQKLQSEVETNAPSAMTNSPTPPAM